MKLKKQLSVPDFAKNLIDETKEITDQALANDGTGTMQDKLAFMYLYAHIKFVPKAVIQEVFRQRFSINEEDFNKLLEG